MSLMYTTLTRLYIQVIYLVNDHVGHVSIKPGLDDLRNRHPLSHIYIKIWRITVPTVNRPVPLKILSFFSKVCLAYCELPRSVKARQ